MMPAVRLPWKPLAFLAPAVFVFVLLAGDGLFSGFFPDEVMNIYGYWREPWSTLLWNNLLIFKGAYRPAGAFFYRPLFDTFGFNPLPYRAVCFVLLSANLLLVFQLARRLSGSLLAASLTALLFSFNAFLSDLYYSSGTIYDLLCFTLCASVLLLYSAWRAAGKLTPLQLTAIAILQILALNSKEIAVALPVALAAFEFLFHPRQQRDFRTPLLTLLLAAAMTWARLSGADSMLVNAAYRPSLAEAGHALSVYTGQLLYRIPAATPGVVSAFILFIVCALFVPRPHIRFAALFSLLAPIPVLLISQRSLYVMYLPMLGFTLVAGGLLALLIPDRFHNLWRALPALFILAAVLIPLHLQYKKVATTWIATENAKVRSIGAALSRQLPSLPKGSRVFFETDPFPEDDWILTMLFRLYYRDDSIQVSRRKRPGETPEGHQYILSLSENPWTLTLRSSPSAAPGTASSPAVPGIGGP
jgi:hypothetical protein